MAKRPNISREFRGELIKSYMRCRALRSHMWDVIPATPSQRSDLGGVLMLLRCESCGTERHDVFSPVTGDLMVRWYDYPESYRDVEKHDVGWWRATWYDSDEDFRNRTINQSPSRSTSKQVKPSGRIAS